MGKIVFYIETKNKLVAKQTLFIDLASYIAEFTENEVYYVNYAHQEDYERHKNTKLKFLDLENCDFSEFVEVTYFVPANYLLHLLSKIPNQPKSKICLYVYDPRAIKWLASHFGRHGDVSEVLNLLQNNLCCSFADILCYEANREYQPIFFPTTLFNKLDEKFQEVPIVDPDVYNIGYYGTITEPRANALRNLIDNLQISELSKPINIHIIGYEGCFSKIDISALPGFKGKIICVGKLNAEQSVEYIRKNCDVILSNGENAVEAATFSVPVVIPVVSDEAFLGNNYVYFHETNGYVYNWDVSRLMILNNEAHTVNRILTDIYSSGKKFEIANLCYEACVRNNSLEKLSGDFLEYVAESSLLVEKCLNLPIISNFLKGYNRYSEKRGSSFNNYLRYVKTGYDKEEVEIKLIFQRFRQFIHDKMQSFRKALVVKRQIKIFNLVQRSYPKKLKAIANLRADKRIKAAFLVMFGSVFPTRSVFEKMLDDTVFDPYIIVIPNISRTYKYQISTYQETFDSLNNDYPGRVFHGYDCKKDEYLELGEEYSVVFFSNPYKHLVNEKHHVEYFLDKNVMPMYSSYGFAALKFWDEVINTNFYNFMWKCTLETESNLNYLRNTEKIKGKNGVVTGYIKMDRLPDAPVIPRTRKRVLICPHHTVWGWKTLNISNFLQYSELFIELPKKFPEVDFVFRPHPLLVSNLKAHKVWTQEQIDVFFERLLENPNMEYDTSGDYFPQFVNSDAMIHDCGSFIGEYLYTQNPCCYMMKSEEQTMDGLVPLGQECMRRYYHAFCEDDITAFIRNVVIEEEDPMKDERERFVREELMVNYPNASDFVLRMIKDELKL